MVVTDNRRNIKYLDRKHIYKKMYAVATLLMNGNSYVPGAIALANSLRIFSHAHLVCMITEDVTERQRLEAAYDEVVVVDRITVRPPPIYGRQAQRIYASWIADSPTKWNILGLDKYDKVLFLDADMIAIAPIDEVFQVPIPAAVFDYHMYEKYVSRQEYGSPGSSSIRNYYGNLKHGDIVPRDAIEGLKTRRDQVSAMGGLVLIEPNRMILDLFKIEIDSIVASLPQYTGSGVDDVSIILFYHNHGYKWHHISITYDLAAYHLYPIFRADKIPVHILHFVTQFKPWVETREEVRRNFPQHLEVYDLWHTMYKGEYLRTQVAAISGQNQTLRQRLEDIFVPILGQRSVEVLDQMFPLYAKSFIHVSANPVANYDLLEAYGDRFLSGQYMWYLLSIPGVISADQVGKISLYFQDRYRLEQIADHFFLGKYIVTGKDVQIDTKIKSDIIEALIAAIGISWQRVFKRGDWAMKTFIAKVFGQLFEVDPLNYRLKYENPLDRLKAMVEQAYLDRRLLIVSPPQQVGGEIVVTVSYDGYPLGTGRASMTGVYQDTAITNATRAAYLDAIENNRLQEYIRQRS